MQCPKCGNTLRSDMYCEHCKEFLFNMDKPQKGDVAKSWLMVFSITVGAFVVVFGLIAGIVTFQEKQAENREIKAAYSEIQSTYEEGDYVEVLNMISDFNKTYNGKNKNLTEETNNILQKVEEELYKKLSNNDDYKEVKRLCSKYLESYPEGKYVESVTKMLSESSEKLALEEINTAKEKIRSGELAEAKSMLDNIVSNDSISENITSQAQKLINTIKNTPATDFEITGGSSNVYLISEKNYGVICPYCGYKSGAMGSSSIYMELKKHYPGEIETSTNTFMCASAFQGGCREFSKYNLTIEYK